MNIGLVQGISLSLTTRNAWREAGVVILHRRYTEEEYANRIARGNFDTIINAGSRRPFLTGLEPTVLNPPDVVGVTSDRARFDTCMDGLSPVYRPEGGETGDPVPPVGLWLKGPGHRGANKIFVELVGRDLGVPDGWTVQQHVRGQEYRVHSVGELLVQGNLRFGTPTERDYQWCGVRQLPSPVRDSVKQGVRRLAEQAEIPSNQLLIAWDVIFDGESAFLLEANTAPGVNQATAERIVRQIGETA